MGLLAALYGAEKGNAFIKECMDFFGNRHFINSDGSLYEQEINPGIMARLLVKHGFRYVDKQQQLAGGMLILPSSVLLVISYVEQRNRMPCILWIILGKRKISNGG